jgi:pimeloyl-[acyl-carrier protein] synthase
MNISKNATDVAENSVDKNVDSNIVAFNPRVPAFRANPYPTYEALRRQSPIHYRADHSDWIITRYAHVAALLKDDRLEHRVYKDDDSRIAPNGDRVLDLRQGSIKLRQLWFADQNPPDHTRLRKPFHGAFCPSQIAKLHGRMQELTDAALDRVMPQGQMDIIHDLGHPLSFAITCDILGIPDEARPALQRLTRGLHSVLGVGTTSATREGGLMAMMGLTQYFRSCITRWRAHPPAVDNLICALMRAQVEGHLSEEEMLSQCSLILIAGQVSSQHLIGNGVLALLRHPDQLQMLRRQPELLDTAVSELLRYDVPTQSVLRIARIDIEIAGKTIHRGEVVRLVIGAANHDPEIFLDPDRLDITRQPNPHLSFGSGIHYCIGAGLATLEAQVAIGTLLGRLPRLSLQTKTLHWEDTSGIRGLKSLPVIFQ